MGKRPTNVRFLLRFGWLQLTGVTLFFWSYPVNIGILRLFLLLAIPTVCAGATALLWCRKRLRWAPSIALAMVVLPFLLPGRGQNTERLRRRYVAALRLYEGTRYVWGGETKLGIDCSGLTRKGLMVAHFSEGVLTLNATHLRAMAELWWYDCSARALSEGYREWTRPVLEADSVNSIDPSALAPGDLAVTRDGVHVLAHLGDGEWIEADPGLGRVFRARVPVTNPWFDMPVSVIRWRRLDRATGNGE